MIVTAASGVADAIVVLAGAPVYGERLDHASRLFHAGRAPRIILTDDGSRQSWSRTLQRNPLAVERGALRLQRAGIPADSIVVLPGRVSSTYDEAVAARRYAGEHRLERLLVVTSNYHTRRAYWTFRRVFRQTATRVGVEAAAPTTSPGAFAWMFRPSGWTMVAGEYFKLAYYWFRYA